MEILIERTNVTGDAIDGTLCIDGQYVCDVVENVHVALPAGRYLIVRHYCKQYERFMPLVEVDSHSLPDKCSCCEKLEDVNLNKVMPCICPMLKPGNGVHHRKDGSIILGTRIIPGCLIHPLDVFAPLAERVRKAIKRGAEITLVLTDGPCCSVQNVDGLMRISSAKNNNTNELVVTQKDIIL